MNRNWLKDRGPRSLEASLAEAMKNNSNRVFVPSRMHDINTGLRDKDDVVVGNNFGLQGRRQSAPHQRMQHDTVLDMKHTNNLLPRTPDLIVEECQLRRASTSDIETKKNEASLYPSVRMVTSIPEIDLERIFGETDQKKKKISLSQIDRRTLSGRNLNNRQSSTNSFCSIRSSSQRSMGSMRSNSQLWLTDDLAMSTSKAGAVAVAASTNDLAMSKLEAKIASASPTSSSNDSQHEVEITPGVFMMLRGSAETWQAIRLNRITNAKCICCCTTLHCVRDAEYVICPDCRVISPVYSNSNNSSSNNNISDDDLKSDGKSGVTGGVGLGFKPEDMDKWKTEQAWQQPQQQSPQAPRQMHWVSSARY